MFSEQHRAPESLDLPGGDRQKETGGDVNDRMRVGVIFEDQKIKFHNAEHKYYVVIQTLEFIEKFLGKESHHYAAVKSFSLPNSFPDTSDSLYDIKLRNTERRFNACIDGIVDTIIKTHYA